MTVSSSTARVAYSGNDSTTAFAVPFYFLASSHLEVILQAADGTEETQALTTDYTVTGAGSEAGGTVTMLTAPASGETLIIQRNVPATQTSDFPPNDRLPAATVENALDKLTMLVQQIVGGYGIERVLKLFDGDTDGSGRYNANGNRIQSLADGTDATDAATYGQVEDLVARTLGTDSGVVPMEYDDVGDGGTTTFTLGTTASWTVSNGLFYEVFIDGLRQRFTDDYSIGSSGANRTITFVAAPANLSVIYVIVRGYAQEQDTGALTLRADLASVSDRTKGHALISYPRTEAEQTAGVTPADYTVQEVYLSRYGAAFDGVTDDSAALQAALNVLGTTGGTLYLDKKGTSYIGTGITVPKTPDGYGLRIVGLSPGASKLLFGGTGYLFTVGDGNGTFSSFFNTFEDLSMYGNGAVGQSGAIKLDSAYFWRVKNCIIRDFSTAGARGIYATTAPNYHGEVSLTQFRNVPTGIYFAGSGGIGANSNLIRHNWFGVHSSYAIHIAGGDTNGIDFNEFNGSTTTAIYLDDANYTRIVFNQFDGPTVPVNITSSASFGTLLLGNTGSAMSGIVDSGNATLNLDVIQQYLYHREGLIVGGPRMKTNIVPLIVRAHAALSTDAFRVEDSTSAYLAKVNQSGALEVKTAITVHGKTTMKNDVAGNSVVAEVNTDTTPTAVGLLLTADSLQSADMAQLKTEGGTLLWSMSPLGAQTFLEQADPAAPAANSAVLYARDNGAGKTQLCVRFPTGAVQVLQTEP